MILAFLVAVGAWVFVVYNYEPMTDITYAEVPVTLSGGEALADRGLAVSDTNISGVTVTLNQKRTDAGRIDKEDNIPVQIGSTVFFALVLLCSTAFMISDTVSSFLYAQF